jgi:hypothetical protein
MTSFTLTKQRRPDPSRVVLWLDRPRSQGWCVVSWIFASTVFVGVVTVLGGLTKLDSLLSTYSSWSIAHGNVACAYPPGSSTYFPMTAPLYTLVAGGLSAIFRVGHGIPFPKRAVLGNRCLQWWAPMTHWAARTHALTPTLRFGYVGWFILAAGVVAVMRSSGRGRNGWEPAVLIAIACAPPVFSSLNILFHPQDLLAMGLILLAVSSAQRDAWVWSGFFSGLAFSSQQFSLLAIALLIVLVPAKRRLIFSLIAVATLEVIVIPLMALTSGRALWVALTGSGGGGVLVTSIPWELHLRGTASGDLLRVLPVVAVFVMAWWARRRLSLAVMEPLVLLSLLATSMAIRLVFEGGLYGYYFMASAVTLILLDFVRRTFRLVVILWLAIEALAFSPVPWGIDRLTYGVPMWVWQLILVPLTFVLAISPLIERIKRERSSATLAVVSS